MTSSGVINSSTIAGLTSNYTFEIIPDTPASASAGYTLSDRQNAQIWYPPVIDGNNFYYAGWHGAALDPSHKSSILCCRRCSDGQLIFSVNTDDYNLDTSPNFMGDVATLPRSRPFILGDTLYMTNALICNIGPQLFAINKYTGKLKWACAYYTPDGSFITTKGDYSQYTGSNVRLGDLSPVAADITLDDGTSVRYIFVGSSSGQNLFNPGYFAGNFPTYTDQGFLFCIQDLGTTSQLVWRTPTCAPNLKVGDTIVKGGDPAFDPFRPTEDKVVLESITSPTNNFIQPYYLSNPPAPGLPNTVPIAAIVLFNSTTVINSSLVQSIWSNSSIPIYQDSNRTIPYTLSQLINIWLTEQSALAPGASVRHTIWSYVNSSIINTAISQGNNYNIMYFKYMQSGQTLTEFYDAQNLNYWGNGVWGARPTLDLNRNLVYFSSGQAHELPLDENLFYNRPENNFFALKVPVVDTINKYIAGQATLTDVNNAKQVFTSVIRSKALNVADKSPRGRMSYSDSVMGAYILPYKGKAGKIVPGGTKAFGVRIVPSDSFTFIDNDPKQNVFPLNTLDGDASSGVEMFVYNDDDCSESTGSSSSNNSAESSVWLVTSPKCALTPIIDVSNIKKNVNFDDNNLSMKGVILTKLVFSGPNSQMGGSNYQNASTSVNGMKFISCQINLSPASGARGSDGSMESHVTFDGRVLFPTNSYIQAVNIPSGNIIWETAYNTMASCEVSILNDVAFSAMSNGTLLAHSTNNGAQIWSLDGKTLGMNGGIVGCATTQTQILWIDNYSAFGIVGTYGPNGASFVIPQ